LVRKKIIKPQLASLSVYAPTTTRLSTTWHKQRGDWYSTEQTLLRAV
jgi:hypothetical protein